MKYIDADRLIEYLEKEADKEFKATEKNANSPVVCHFHNGCRMMALDTIDFIKRLQQEQPCEDLEAEIERVLEDLSFRATINSGGFTTTVLDYPKIAKHFYELGKGGKV